MSLSQCARALNTCQQRITRITHAQMIGLHAYPVHVVHARLQRRQRLSAEDVQLVHPEPKGVQAHGLHSAQVGDGGHLKLPARWGHGMHCMLVFDVMCRSDAMVSHRTYCRVDHVFVCHVD